MEKTHGKGDDTYIIANNTLKGGTGADKLLGGAGDDIYIVDNVGDAVTEYLNEGLDTVQSSVTHTLAADVENLSLTGSAVINGTGNALDKRPHWQQRGKYAQPLATLQEGLVKLG